MLPHRKPAITNDMLHRFMAAREDAAARAEKDFK